MVKHKTIFKNLGLTACIMLSLLLWVSPVKAEEEAIEVPDLENQENVNVIGEKPAGSGTVIDYAKSGNREFYTIMTEDDSVYYLVIDKDKDTQNVYYLKEINNTDLEKSPSQVQKPSTPQTPTTPTNPPQNNVDDELPDADVVGASDYTTLILIGGTMLIVGVVGYYVIISKPKKEKHRMMSKAQGNDGDDYSFDEAMAEYGYQEEDEGH